jgi:hypothetical protein
MIECLKDLCSIYSACVCNASGCGRHDVAQRYAKLYYAARFALNVGTVESIFSDSDIGNGLYSDCCGWFVPSERAIIERAAAYRSSCDTIERFDCGGCAADQ